MAARSASALVGIGKGSIAAALIAVAGCGEGTSTPTPTSPAPPPSIPITVSVAPNPLAASIVRSDGGTVTYRIAADVTLSASRATGAQIDQVTTTVSFSQRSGGLVLSLSMSQSRSVSLQVPHSGTVTYAHTEEFGSGSGDTITWRIDVRGIDAQGRAFTASSGNIRVDIATSSANHAASEAALIDERRPSFQPGGPV